MHAHSFLWHYLWLAPHALQIAVAIVMVRRRLVREFPVFFAYTLFQIVEEGTLFILDHSPAIRPLTYWYAHWVGLAVDVPLRFAIIAESFFAFDKGTLRLAASKAVSQNLPPALAETIPLLPTITAGKSAAVLCSGFSCQPPVTDPEQLKRSLKVALSH